MKKQSIQWVGYLVLGIILHGVLLFAVIPALGPNLKAFYNEEQFADGYELLADNLNAGYGYRFYPETAKTLMREPGYPLFLAALRRTFGRNMVVVEIANMVLAIMTAACMVLLAKRIFSELQLPRSLPVVVAPLLYLFSPGILIAESRGGLELLFSLLITLFMLGVDKAVRTNELRYYAASGAILGVTVLVRSTPMLFPAFLFLYLFFVERKRIATLAIVRNVTVMICVMVTVMSPWIIRNYKLTGKFVPTASVLGVSAQAGQYINTHLFEGRPWWLLDREASRERDKIAADLGLPFEDGKQGYYQTFYRSDDEIRFSSYLMHSVIEQYKQSPLVFVRCLTQNVFNFWFAGKSWMATAGDVAAQLPYLILAGIGIVFCAKARRLRTIGPLILFIGYVWAVHIPILAQARYSIPLLSLTCCLGTLGLMALRKPAAAVSPQTSNASLVESL